MSDPRKLAMYELGRSAKLHMAAAERQIELIRQGDVIIDQNETVVRLLREVVHLLQDPRA